MEIDLEFFSQTDFVEAVGTVTTETFDTFSSQAQLNGNEFGGFTIDSRRITVVDPQNFAPGLIVGGSNLQSQPNGISASINYDSSGSIIFDDLDDIFTFNLNDPVNSAGLFVGNIGNSNNDATTPTIVEFFDGSNNLVESETLTQTHPGLIGAGANNRIFYGVSSDRLIAKVVITNMAADGDGILLDDFQFGSANAAANQITGDGSDNLIIGTSGIDIITSGAGADTINIGPGNDIIDGGTGVDTARYSGNLSDYEISRAGATYSVLDKRSGSPDGTDTLANTEKLQFADQLIELDTGTGSTAPTAVLNALFVSNLDAAKGITAAHSVLLDGVPNQAGYTFLINNAVSTNFGAGPGVIFNQENIFINLVNNLVQGNSDASARFGSLATGATLVEKVTSIYNSLVPESEQTAEGRAFFTRIEGLSFYENVAQERGVAGADGAAVVAMASLLSIVVAGDFGVGNAVNDLIRAVDAGSSIVPIVSTTFTPLEFADGTQFDADEPNAILSNSFVSSNSAPSAYDDADNFYAETQLIGIGEQQGFADVF